MSSILYLFTELKSFLQCYKDRSDTSKSPNIPPCNFLLEISKPFWREKKKIETAWSSQECSQHSFPNKGVRKSNEVAKESVNGVREDRQAD